MSSTAKKPNNSQLSQPQLGQYRQLGPKIHEFGAANNHNNQPLLQQQTQQKQQEQEQKPIMVQYSHGNQPMKHSRQTQSNGVPAVFIQEQNAAAATQNLKQAAKNKEFKVQSSANAFIGQATINRQQQQQQQQQVEQSQHRQQLLQYQQQQKISQEVLQNQQQQQHQKSKNDLIPHQPPPFWSNSNSNAASRLPTQENNNNEDGGLNNKQLLDNATLQHEQAQTQQEDEGLDGVDSLKAQLRTIFDFYTTFGDRHNLSSLKSSKFYKMMSDAGVLSQTLSSTRLDLLFCQTNKHNPNMSFNTFLEMLPKLSLLKYPQLTQEEAMLALITQQLNPLYVSIMEKTDLGLELRSFAQPLEIDCIEILTPLYPMLQKIYESYFPWERTNSMTKDKAQARSLKALFVFLAEYNICPTHFNKSTGFLLFNYLIDLVNLNVQFAVTENPTTIFGFQDFGKSFTFQRFLVYLIRSAIISYENRLDASKYPCSSHLEKLNLLLERMEVSEGNLNIQRKTHSTNNQQTSLLIPESLVMQLSVNKSIDWSTPRASQFGTFRSKMNSGISSSRQQSSIMSALSPKRSNSSHRKSLLLEKLGQSFVSSTNAFEKHNEALVRIFRAYCAYGEPMNQSTLKTIKLIRLLTDAGIMKKIKNSQTNMSQLNSSGASKKGGMLLSSSSKRPSSGQIISLSASVNKKQLNSNDIDNNNNKEDRFLSKIDMDFMVAKLTGSKWIQQFNKESTSFNRKIQSPKLGFSSYLHRTDDATGAKGKIEYEHFLQLLEMISEKLLPELDAESSLQVIIEQILTVTELPDSPANQTTSSSSNTSQHRKTMQDYLLVLMDTLKDSEIVQLLGEVHLSLLIYYRIYQDMHGLMNITQFLRFFKDFEIFPAMASKPKLATIFYALAQVQANQSSNSDNTQLSQQQQRGSNNNTTPTTQNQSQMSGKSSRSRSRFLNESSLSISGMPDQSESELIDQHLFVEAIALLAIDIYTEQPSNVFKIIMILERMNNSEGPIRIQKQLGHTRSTDGQHWDMLHSIRRKYPEFYQSKKTNQNTSRIQAMNQNNNNNNSNIHSNSQFLSPSGTTRQASNTFEDIIKRSLGSAGVAEPTVLSEQLITNNSKVSNSAGGLFSLSLSQQYALQQKEINERAAQYYNQQQQHQQQTNTEGHLSQARESLEQAQQIFEQPGRQQFQQGNGQQQQQRQQLRVSPLNAAFSNGVQNAPSTDYISTAKKPKNTTIPNPAAASKIQPGSFFNKSQN